MYDNNQSDIYILRGTNNLISDVKELYLDLFEESKIKYNDKQTRSDRKIDNYFNHISNSEKSDLACEIIIELGDMDYWESIKKSDKLKMNDVFKEQIKYLEDIVPNFKVASAVSHFDEHSPHLHIVEFHLKVVIKMVWRFKLVSPQYLPKNQLKLFKIKCE